MDQDVRFKKLESRITALEALTPKKITPEDDLVFLSGDSIPADIRAALNGGLLEPLATSHDTSS
jgi:hypothetical protein